MSFDLTIITNYLALGICLFVTTSAAARFSKRPLVIWLVVFFAAHIMGLGVALAIGHQSSVYPLIVLAAIPALLVYSPSLYFYVRGLTGMAAPHASQLIAHFSPAILLALVSLALFAMPPGSRGWIGDPSAEPATLIGRVLQLLLLAVMVGFIIQALAYAAAIFRRLSKHRNSLKDMFASTEEKELGWIMAVTVLLVVYALQTPLPVLIRSITGQVTDLSGLDAAVSLALVWTLGLWGLRQVPVISADSAVDQVKTERYAKSTLPPETMVRIAQKIEQVVVASARFADPDFSLGDLSSATGFSKNHLSETLNTQIGERFFDYVNRHRIAAAKIRLRDSDDGIAAILHEVGFNSRSAFYRAFRRETGESPAEWRRSAKAGADSLTTEEGGNHVGN